MTDLDLDAIRSRAANAAISPHLASTGQRVLTKDVPALLDEVGRLRQVNHDLRGEVMRRSSESWLAGYEKGRRVGRHDDTEEGET